MKPGIGSLIGTAALGLSILSGTIAAGSAHASYVVCRTDPAVTLDNGVEIDMWAEIGADPSQVENVSYVLHVPHNAQATSVVYDQYRAIESLTIVADQTGNRYQVDTTVTTNTSASVTAYATLDRGKTKTSKVAGKNAQKLTIEFKA